MFLTPRSLVFFVMVIVFLGSHMVQANSTSEVEEGSTSETDTTNQPLDYAGESISGDEEKPDILNREAFQSQDLQKTNESSSRTHSTRTSEPIFKCRCWIGWQYYIKHKYVDFGEIGLFPQRFLCKQECSRKCTPWLDKKEFLCQKIGACYDSRKQRSVGCFSQFGYPNSQENIWEFNNTPFELCCQSSGRNCAEFGPTFYYNSCLGLCVKNTRLDCPPDLINNVPSTPHCCDNHKYSVCKKPRCQIHSVPCPCEK